MKYIMLIKVKMPKIGAKSLFGKSYDKTNMNILHYVFEKSIVWAQHNASSVPVFFKWAQSREMHGVADSAVPTCATVF